MLLALSHDSESKVAFSHGTYDQVTDDVGYPKISQVNFAFSPGFIVTSDSLTCGASVELKFESETSQPSSSFANPLFTSDVELEFTFGFHFFIPCVKCVATGIADPWITNFQCCCCIG